MDTVNQFSNLQTLKEISMGSDEMMVALINMLSSSIKTYYKKTKTTLKEIDFAINNINNNKEKLDLIEHTLKNFLLEAKDIFLHLKTNRNQGKIKNNESDKYNHNIRVGTKSKFPSKSTKCKLEITTKFKNSNEIYSLFYSIILETLNNNNCPAVFDDYTFDNFNKPKPTKEIVQDSNLKKVEGGFSFGDFNKFTDEVKKISVTSASYKNDDISVLKSSNYNFTQASGEQNTPCSIKEEISNVKAYDIIANTEVIESPTRAKNITQQSFINPLDYRIIGTFFNTYIVIQSEERLFIIDQHAGHERVLYDTFMEQFEKNKLINQPLLIPYSFTVNEIEKDLIENNKIIFKNFGFEVEEFGYLTYKITSIPSVLEHIKLDEFVLDILKDTNKISSNSNQIKDFFAKCACKAAVKGGQKLSDNEIKFLLNKIIENKTTLLCPHGRPICIKLSKQDIEKMFKRIV